MQQPAGGVRTGGGRWRKVESIRTLPVHADNTAYYKQVLNRVLFDTEAYKKRDDL